MGRAGLRSRDGAATTSTPTRWRGPASLAPNVRGRRPDAQLYLQHCAACHRDDLPGAPPQIPSLVGIAARRTPSEICARSSGRAPGGCPASRAVAERGRTRSSQFVCDRRGTSDADRATAPSTATLKYRFTGYQQVPRSRRLSGDRAALGHAQRDRPEHRRLRLEDPARRVSGAGRAGIDGHRQRELRRPGRHRRRAGLHRRDELRQEGPRVRQGDRRAALGGDAAVLGNAARRRPTRSAAASSWSSRPAAARTPGQPSGGAYVAFALKRPATR